MSGTTAFKDELSMAQFISQGKRFCFLSVQLSFHLFHFLNYKMCRFTHLSLRGDMVCRDSGKTECVLESVGG